MTKKAYIVANEQQEREVLEKLESQDIIWKYSLSHKTTQFTPSRYLNIVTFPYILKVIGSTVSYGRLDELDEHEIVYDGRKEEKMSDKYVVSQEFMNELEEWRKNNNSINRFVSYVDLGNIPEVVKDWWIEDLVDTLKTNNRLIAIIRWVNGEDVFELEKPKKWVVRSKEHNNFSEYTYVTTDDIFSLAITMGVENATKFNTKEEAESWANAHQEVIEVEE